MQPFVCLKEEQWRMRSGSYSHYFDWIPESYKIGPWSPLTILTLTLLLSILVYTMPYCFHVDDWARTDYASAFTGLWWYNFGGSIWMAFVLFSLLEKVGLVAMISYTMVAWVLLMIRHGLSALVPFLPHDHVFITANEMLRFPSFVYSSVTFIMWTFFLMPVSCVYFLDTRRERQRFLGWCCNFWLSQIHVCNIYFSIMNTFITTSPRRFVAQDLWLGLAFPMVFCLFYLFVLEERFGIYVYAPALSPRKGKTFALFISACAIEIYSTFRVANMMLPSDNYPRPGWKLLTVLFGNILIICEYVHRKYSRLPAEEHEDPYFRILYKLFE